jgi:hypothetical protein
MPTGESSQLYFGAASSNHNLPIKSRHLLANVSSMLQQYSSSFLIVTRCDAIEDHSVVSMMELINEKGATVSLSSSYVVVFKYHRH